MRTVKISADTILLWRVGSMVLDQAAQFEKFFNVCEVG
jgi:hypothetical protein